MKKLVLLMVLVMAFSVVSVIAPDGDDQEADANVDDVIDISVSDNLEFDGVAPGELSDPVTSTITLSTLNNVDLTVAITLTVDESGLFEHLIFDVNDDGVFDELDSEIGPVGSPAQTIDIADDSEDSTVEEEILVALNVPEGFPSGPASTGTVNYLATADNTE